MFLHYKHSILSKYHLYPRKEHQGIKHKLKGLIATPFQRIRTNQPTYDNAKRGGEIHPQISTSFDKINDCACNAQRQNYKYGGGVGSFCIQSKKPQQYRHCKHASACPKQAVDKSHHRPQKHGKDFGHVLSFLSVAGKLFLPKQSQGVIANKFGQVGSVNSVHKVILINLRENMKSVCQNIVFSVE